VVPLGNTLLYVEPLYLQADTGALPELKRVIVAHSDRIDLGANLQEALGRLVGERGGGEAPPGTVGTPPAANAGSAAPGGTPGALALLRAAEAALEHGDWVEHGRLMQELRRVLETAAGSARP
jgi:uncharacterized membrane protein (UPF0182 family)